MERIDDSPDIKERLSVTSNSPVHSGASEYWLCPIQSNANRRGILQMSEKEYFDLVDKTGRMTRMDKRGAISAVLAPILQRIGAIPEAWVETSLSFWIWIHFCRRPAFQPPQFCRSDWQELGQRNYDVSFRLYIIIALIASRNKPQQAIHSVLAIYS